MRDDRVDTGYRPARTPWPRRSARIPLLADVVLRRAGQNKYRVTVYDISPHGCRLEFVEQPKLDERVWIKFDGLEAIEALVCWTGASVAGLEFERRIHAAVFDMLVSRFREGPLGSGQ